MATETSEDPAERARRLNRERGARFAARHPERKRQLCREAQARLRAKNPEATREQWRQRHAAHREKERLAQKARYARSPEASRLASAKWHAANPDRAKALWAAWYRRNAAAHVATRANARARRSSAPGTHTGAERSAVFSSHHSLCVYCLSPASTIDHVEPLMRGGRNDSFNLAPACARCNSSKGDTPLLVWLARRIIIRRPQ